ncbi:MAG: FlgD immunoglobulin-like domain containing protein [Candidatus Cloacimonadales bacterium]
MIDPENGDYRVEPGTAAVDYGCQIFGENRILAIDARTSPSAERREQIEVSGIIEEDTHWNAEQVFVTGDILVEEAATLSIEPGTEIIFSGYYGIEIKGGLWAAGNPEQRIIFSAANPELFSADDLPLGCWKGLFFSESATTLPSKIEFAIIQYAKAIEPTEADFNQAAGGAIRIYNRQNIIIANSVLRYNLAYTGGAIFCYKMANPTIFGNLIYHNYALENVAAVDLAYSYPKIYNNTIVDNFIHNQDPYVETCALRNYLSKPEISNNIIRDNVANLPYLHQQLWEGKEFYSRSNNIEDNLWQNGNIDLDPEFLAGQDWEYQISANSACADAGTLELAYLTDQDLLGNERVSGRTIDLGCYETSSTFAEPDLPLPDLALAHYPNPAYLKNNQRNFGVTISYQLPADSQAAEIEIYNLKGQRLRTLALSASSKKAEVVWDGKDFVGKIVASGIYYYQLSVSGQPLASGRITLLK